MVLKKIHMRENNEIIIKDNLKKQGFMMMKPWKI
jgi:hypothetical protein